MPGPINRMQTSALPQNEATADAACLLVVDDLPLLVPVTIPELDVLLCFLGNDILDIIGHVTRDEPVRDGE